MSLNVSDDRSKVIINYLRPPENLARERILLRGSVIKAIYGQGNWVEWNDLWQRLVPVDLNILRQTCDYLESANLLSQFELNKYKLTSSGYSFFEKQILPSTNTVFIIASCDPKHKEWVDYYKKEISAVGLRPYFQEKEEPPREIIIEIYEQLRNCAFVLADLTGGSENCLYELGYAHARGKRIILVRDDSEVRKGKGEKVRLTFDLNQFRHSFRFGKEDWESENNKAFRTELKDRISKVKTDLFETQFFRLTGHE
jgi:nucleoside 2-deoxyribosyltransferase